MNEVLPTFNNKVSFFENIEILWKAKWRILVITIAFVIGSLILNNLLRPSFTAVTDINPLNTSEVEKYNLSNSINFSYYLFIVTLK